MEAASEGYLYSPTLITAVTFLGIASSQHCRNRLYSACSTAGN